MKHEHFWFLTVFCITWIFFFGIISILYTLVYIIDKINVVDILGIPKIIEGTIPHAAPFYEWNQVWSSMNSTSVGIALPISCNGFSLKRQDVIQRGKNSFKVLKLVLIRVCSTCIFFMWEYLADFFIKFLWFEVQLMCFQVFVIYKHRLLTLIILQIHLCKKNPTTLKQKHLWNIFATYFGPIFRPFPYKILPIIWNINFLSSCTTVYIDLNIYI